jgi:hypothetical protein
MTCRTVHRACTPQTPYRAGELLLRRRMLEQGLLL